MDQSCVYWYYYLNFSYYYNLQCKYPVNPWSAAGVAIRALPQERFAFCRVSIAGRIALPLRSAMSEL